MATEESKLKDKIKKLLKSRSAWYFLPVSRGYGVHGIPDFICCVPVTITPDMVGKKVGFFIGIEAKAEKKYATERQQFQINQITGAGGLAFDLRPADLEQLEKLLKNLTKEI